MSALAPSAWFLSSHFIPFSSAQKKGRPPILSIDERPVLFPPGWSYVTLAARVPLIADAHFQQSASVCQACRCRGHIAHALGQPRMAPQNDRQLNFGNAVVRLDRRRMAIDFG